MGLTRIAGLILLAGLVVVAHFALGKQAEWNGLFTLDQVFVYSNRILPNTDIPIRLPRTGNAKVDNYFAFMAAFFWGTLDPRNARAHVQGNYLVGTLGSIWLLMLVEAHRGRRSTSFLVMTYVFEFLGELVGIGLFTPIWCVFHLLLTSAPSTKSDLSAPNKGLGALGYAIVLGHAVPTFLMIRTQPDGEGFLSQQWWSVIRLFHPALVFVSWKVLQTLQSVFLGTSSDAAALPEQRLSSIRKFYVFSILLSGFFHASSLALLLAPYLVPGWLPASITKSLDLGTYFIPVAFWDASKVPYSMANPIPFETGVAVFLQWDNLCAASAIVVWAASLYIEAAGKVKSNAGNGVSVILQSGLVGIAAGPGAAAAYFLMERDSAAHIATGSVEGDKKHR